MKARWIRLFLVGILSAFSANAENRPIKIGYLIDFTGKGAFVGQQSRAGAELARRELLAQGFNVSIVYEDHRTDGKIAVTAAKKLLDIDHVDGIACDMTPACVPASPVMAAAKKVMMYQSPATSILASNPYAFKDFVDFEAGCRDIAQHWKNQGIVKVAHLKANAEYGELCLKGSRQVFPDQELYEYNSGDDLRSLVPKLKKSGVQAVFQTGFEGDFINRLRASYEFGLNLPTGLTYSLLTQTVIKSVPSDVLNNSVMFGFKTLTDKFISDLKNAGLYESDTNIESAAIAYMHINQLANAISVCPPNEVACQVAQISKARPNPIIGFQGWKDRAAIYPAYLRRWQNGKIIEIN